METRVGLVVGPRDDASHWSGSGEGPDGGAASGGGSVVGGRLVPVRFTLNQKDYQLSAPNPISCRDSGGRA